MWQGIRCLAGFVAVAMMAGAAFGAAATPPPAQPPSSTPAVAAGAAGGAAAELWTDNFAKAKVRARNEGKDLLLDFTGSDWCGWCIKLKAEVFDTEKFKAEAPKKFVLVELDFPQKRKLAEATRKQNDALQGEFGVEGFPTIVLLDSEGRLYAKTGYRPGGAQVYLAHLDEFRKVRAERDKLLAEADKVKGVERAKILDKMIELMARGDIGPMENRPWLEEIVKLDDRNEAGLKAKYEKMIRLADAVKLAQAGKLDEALKAADAAAADLKLTGPDLQDALYLKALVLHMRGDDAAAKAALQAALDAAPKSDKAGHIGDLLKNLDKQKQGPVGK